ncbi:uncharacterized protein LMH87_007887 [Akanthomyces muscarius]|uniref:Uncharacterized protein n=1 Tax=Akanthomyces muscarius TaxID=2231603 RepID=A0A9W8QMI9_AKAMU|nr:uncharacterized protein LMH87_007887 [Akanthomyces muscarius]KAJ4159952.1 hypothetical protein LMH87_007887 [Akanthomyces muscarius]
MTNTDLARSHQSTVLASCLPRERRWTRHCIYSLQFAFISFATVPTQACSFNAARFFLGHLRTCTGTLRADPNLASLLLYAHKICHHIPGSPRLLHFITSDPYIHAQSCPKLSDRHLYQLIRNVKSI